MRDHQHCYVKQKFLEFWPLALRDHVEYFTDKLYFVMTVFVHRTNHLDSIKCDAYTTMTVLGVRIAFH